MTLSDPRIAEIRAQLAAITPGPWRARRELKEWNAEGIAAGFENTTPPADFAIETVYDDPQTRAPWPVVGTYSSGYYERQSGVACRKANAEFIASAPSSMEYLLGELDALRAQLEEATKEREQLDHYASQTKENLDAAELELIALHNHVAELRKLGETYKTYPEWKEGYEKWKAMGRIGGRFGRPVLDALKSCAKCGGAYFDEPELMPAFAHPEANWCRCTASVSDAPSAGET